MTRAWGPHLSKVVWVIGGLVMTVSPAMAQIEEIVVTATKQSKALQDVSASVSAFSSDQLEARGLANAQDLAFGVPGLIYGETQGTPQITIRGIGLSVETGAAEEGVASYINGVVLPRAQLANLAFGDLERAEVLRGPQGTLYGRNATGGAINYITKRPTDEFEVSAGGELSSFGTYSGEVAVSGPVIEDHVAVRFYAKYKESEGYVENLSQYSSQDRLVGSEDLALRGTIVVQPFEDVAVDFTVGHVAREGTFSSMQLTNYVGNPNPLLNLPSNEPYFTLEPNKTYHDYQDYSDLNATFASLQVTWEIADLEFKATTGYTKFDTLSDADGDFRDPRSTDPGGANPLLPVPLPNVDGNFVLGSSNDFKAFSQELTFAGEVFNGMNVVLGAFYLSSTGVFNIGAKMGPRAAVPGLQLVDYKNDEENESLGVFMDLSYAVTDWMRLLGGVRWGYDTKAAEQSDGGPTTATSNYNLDGSCDLDGELKWTNLSPKLGVEVDVTEASMAYVTYQQATKPGGHNIADCGFTFDQEEIAAYEIGFKTSLFNQRVTLNAAGFYYDYRNYQVFQNSSPTSAEVLNAPQTTVKGVELELAAQPFSFLRLDFGGSYLDARYDEFFSIDAVYKVPEIGNYGVAQDLAGNRLTRAPKYSLNAGLQFDVPVDRFRLGMASFRIEGTYIDEVFFRQFNEDFDRQGAYAVANIFVSLTSSEGNVRLRGFIKNVTDEAYIVSQFSNPLELFVTLPGAEGRQATLVGIYGPPRSIGVTLNVDF